MNAGEITCRGLKKIDTGAIARRVVKRIGYDREADIAFSIGLMKEYVKVSQTGQKGQIDYNEQLNAAGIPAGLVRMSCGLESAADLIADISQALEKV